MCDSGPMPGSTVPEALTDVSAIEFRAPTFADAGAVLALLVARDLVDYGVPDMTLAELEDEWSAESFDLGADAIVAQTPDGVIAGYAIIRRPGAIGFRVSRSRGIGHRYPARSAGPASESASSGERVIVRRSPPAAPARASCCSAPVTSTSAATRVWCARSTGVSASRRWATGWCCGRSRPRRIPGRCTRSMSSASPPTRIFRPRRLEEFTDEHLRPREFAPELSLVVHDADTMVGFLLARRWREQAVGFIDLLAVHPAWRRRGVGSALLRTAFARFAADGLREAQLGVASDNPAGAADLRTGGPAPALRRRCLRAGAR